MYGLYGQWIVMEYVKYKHVKHATQTGAEAPSNSTHLHSGPQQLELFIALLIPCLIGSEDGLPSLLSMSQQLDKILRAPKVFA
jgi:hypothetical protein